MSLKVSIPNDSQEVVWLGGGERGRGESSATSMEVAPHTQGRERWDPIQEYSPRASVISVFGDNIPENGMCI